MIGKAYRRVVAIVVAVVVVVEGVTVVDVAVTRVVVDGDGRGVFAPLAHALSRAVARTTTKTFDVIHAMLSPGHPLDLTQKEYRRSWCPAS